MALDPSIILQQRAPTPPPDVATQVELGLSLQDAALKRQQAMNAAADDAATRSAFQMHTGQDGQPDFNAIISDLASSGHPNAALKVQSSADAHAKDVAANALVQGQTDELNRKADQSLLSMIDPSNPATLQAIFPRLTPTTQQVLKAGANDLPGTLNRLSTMNATATDVIKARDDAFNQLLKSLDYQNGAPQRLTAQAQAANTLIASSPDQATLTQHLAQLKAAGVDTSTLPATWTPDVQATARRNALTPDQQTTADSTAARNAALAAHEANQDTNAAGDLILKQKAAAATGGLTPEALDQAATAYRQTGKLPALGMGNAPMRQAIMNRAGQLFPGATLAANSAEYSANNATLTQLTKQLSAVDAFSATAGKNLKMFTDLAAKIPDTGVPWLNTPVRSLDQNVVGSENMAAINAARQVALTEIAKVVNNPGLSGQLSDSARQEVLGLNPANATLPQIKRVASVLQQDIQNRHDGLADQVSDIQKRLGGGNSASAPADLKGAPDGSYRDRATGITWVVKNGAVTRGGG